MIHSSPLRVKAAVREEHGTSRQIHFPFRADPVALDGLKLDQTARAAFVLILDNAKSRGWRSRLSNATMGRILGRCPMTISRALGRLESAGLIRRDLIAGGRIRTGILVTWDGVRREGLTGQASVRREDLRGSALASQGLGARAELIRSPIQSQDQTVPFLPPGKDPGEIPDPATAAAYLRALIAKGGRPTTPRAPHHPASPARTPQDATAAQPGLSSVSGAESPRAGRPAPSPAAISTPPEIRPSPPSGPRLDDPRREVARMLDQLAAGFIPPRGGRRRLSPAELQRQLAEVRRKHGAGTRLTEPG